MQILIYKNSKQYGPYSVEEVQKWLASGHLRASDLAYYEGAGGWIPLSAVPGIGNGSRTAAPLAPPPPPPPPLPANVAGAQAVGPPQIFCQLCGGAGQRLGPGQNVCGECGWLRPLAPGYSIDVSAFQWAQDGAAMSALRSLTPLNSAARAVSDNIGRHWIETTLNGVRLGERQLPAVYARAVQAARLLGMPYMPDIYISGERMWDIATYGSDKSAFIVIGTALLNNFQDQDMMFLLAREIGHCRAGHALWKTLGRFMIGEQGPRRGMMAGGLLSMLSPTNLIEGALELPLLGWARQAEITADRAGLLAVGDEEVARRVLLSWSLKSVPLYRQINIAEWMEQQEDDEDEATKLSEIFSSSTPYITRRLKLMAQFARSQELKHWRAVITKASGPAKAVEQAKISGPAKPSGPVKGPASAPGPRPLPAASSSPGPSGAAPDQGEKSAGEAGQSDDLRLVCSACRTGMRIPRSVLANKEALNVRCPNPQCGKTVTLKRQAKLPSAPGVAAAPTAQRKE